jgi:hypothetical protein
MDKHDANRKRESYDNGAKPSHQIKPFVLGSDIDAGDQKMEYHAGDDEQEIDKRHKMRLNGASVDRFDPQANSVIDCSLLG